MEGLEPPHWVNAHLITLTQTLNELSISMVCERALSTPSETTPAFIARNRDLWRLLDVEAQRRLAALPFSITDLDFSDESRWQERTKSPLLTSTELAALRKATQPGAFFDGIQAENLTIELLLQARTASRHDFNGGKLLFGMTDAVAMCVIALSIQQIRFISIHDAHRLRTRFFGNPDLWRELLVAARDTNPQPFTDLQRHLKLSFTGMQVRDA